MLFHLVAWDEPFPTSWIANIIQTIFKYGERNFLNGNPMTTQHNQKLDELKKVFLMKEWHSFHLTGKKRVYIHRKDLLIHKYESYMTQPLTPPQCKIIVAHGTLNHRLAIKNRWGQLFMIDFCDCKINSHTTYL